MIHSKIESDVAQPKSWIIELQAEMIAGGLLNTMRSTGKRNANFSSEGDLSSLVLSY
ncbi:MAG: hypothetical protein ACI88A_002294 [Paraglaciecola sp.]